MASATVTTDLNQYCHLPGIEVVQLEVTDGDDYVSKKFKTILGAIATGNEDNDQHINVTLSGQTATINYNGMTDQEITLMLFGIK